jgi:Ca-activated chloride channel family protein
MSFASPLALVALVAVPLAAVAYVLFQRRRTRFAERFAAAAMLPNVVDREPGWRRHVPVVILLLALATLLVGFARPRAMIPAKRENATVVLAIDSSRSMSAVDIRPSRLAAVKTAALRFLDRLPAKYRVAVVAISTSAEVAAPATRDRRLVKQALSQLYAEGGTALGDGLAEAVKVGRAVPREKGSAGKPGEVPPVSVLLFTDGIQEGGEVPLGQAVARARRLKIPVSTVVVGTAYGFVSIPRVGGFTQIIRVPADPSELKVVARATGGRFYVGPRTADLSGVYKDLGSRIGTTRRRQEVTFAFALGAACLLLVGGSLSAVWLRRVP